MKNAKLFLFVAVMVAMVFAIAPVSAEGHLGQNGPKGDSVIDVAVAVNSEGAYAGQFDTLIFALQATGLADVLDSRNGKVTVFAPTDDAFAALPAGVLDSLVSDPDALANVLLYHVAPGDRDAGEVAGSEQIRMFNGDFVGVYMDGGNVFLTDNADFSADAKVIVPNVGAANGIIHAIDQVLVP
ncbi:MAG: fasciclin domain-containing protein [Candidatus Promineifilaceae bacterium]|nr:fasciclin domain-containing protein [Candidatus Promineifilaceae bacterium]